VRSGLGDKGGSVDCSLGHVGFGPESQNALSHKFVTVVPHFTTRPSTMATPQLSNGSCKQLQNATPEDVDVFNSQHTVQFLSIKKVGNVNNDPSKAPGPDRYRIIMSDGIHYMQAMLATQLNGMVQDNTITKGTVALLEKLTCNYVQEKR